MTRCARDLTPFPLADVLAAGQVVVTMSEGQWDRILAAAYADGCVLLELDDAERPVRAYRKRDPEGRP